MTNCKWHWFIFPWQSEKMDEQLACYNKVLKGGKLPINKRKTKTKKDNKHNKHNKTLRLNR